MNLHAPKCFAVCMMTIAGLSPAVAFATQPGWYMALDGGQAHYTGIAGTAAQWLAMPPASSLPLDVSNPIFIGGVSVDRHENNDTGYRLSVGYQFNPYLGLEAGYVHLGSVDASGGGSYGEGPVCFPPPGVCTFAIVVNVPYRSTATLAVHGWDLVATGSWPISTQWSLFAQLGAFDARTRVDMESAPQDAADAAATNAEPSDARYSTTRWEPTYGVGVNWSPLDRWALRLGWDRYAHLGDGHTIGRFDINLLSVGVVYRL